MAILSIPKIAVYYIGMLAQFLFSECTRGPHHTSESDALGVNAAAIGGGAEGALARLGLLLAAAALDRRFKKKNSIDDVSNAANQTTAKGRHLLSIPPAGTNIY